MDRKRCGFSLVELVITLAIIALLIGILLPALARARATQRRTTCLSNLHQIATAFTLYAQDNNGYGPNDYAEQTWDALIWTYLKIESVYLCPDDEDGYDEDFGTSYEWRDLFAVAYDKPQCALSGKDLLSARPATLALVFDAVVGWHGADTINVGLLDASAVTMSAHDFQVNLDTAVE
jgi:prepilin-type N-terminal cleavage/methylation domain-containing protein